MVISWDRTQREEHIWFPWHFVLEKRLWQRVGDNWVLGKLYWWTWTAVVWAMVPHQPLVFDDMASLRRMEVWEKVNLLRRGAKREVSHGLRRATVSTSDGGSGGLRYQGKAVGGDFLEIGGSSSSSFGATGFKRSHYNSSCPLCFVLYFFLLFLSLY